MNLIRMSVRALLAASVMAAGLASAQDIALRSWTAPPYWTPSAAEFAGVPPGGVRGPRTALVTATPLPFVGITPCRQYDSRNSTVLVQNTARTVPSTGAPCGIPATAQAVALNITIFNITGATSNGVFSVGITSPPATAWINYPATETQRANAGVVGLTVAGEIIVQVNQVAGFVDFVVDVFGYYAPQGIVNTLNALSGDVTFSAGTNVSITPSGQTLTMAAAGAAGPAGPTGPTGPTGPAGSSGWGLSGNAGTTPGTNFVGTTDGQAFEISVNSQRVARFEPAFGLPNVVLGDRGNSVLAGATMATVSGGGWASLFGAGDGDNIVTGNGGTVGGGVGNQAGDNDGNPGIGQYVTVGGGFYNEAFGEISTIAGGHLNRAPGGWSAVPGGYNNQAGGEFSFAVGNSARIRTAAESGTAGGDWGTFVWADSPAGLNTGVDFTSTGPNQFLVRAAGGVGINTNSPGYSLEVASGSDTQIGITSATTGGRVWTLQSSNGQAGGTLAGAFQIVDRTAAASRLLITSAGDVGIGATDPLSFKLAVNGSAAKPGGGSWSLFSDARLKRDIRPLEGTLDRLLALRGVTFEYIEPAAIHELPGTRIGMVAQEVEKVFPDWISEGPDGYRRLTFRGFEALTVEALRDLREEKNAEIAALRSALEAQRAEIAALRGAIDLVRSELSTRRGEK